MVHTETPACTYHLNVGTNYGGGSDWNYDVDDCNLGGGDCSGGREEREFQSRTFQNPNGTGGSDGNQVSIVEGQAGRAGWERCQVVPGTSQAGAAMGNEAKVQPPCTVAALPGQQGDQVRPTGLTVEPQPAQPPACASQLLRQSSRLNRTILDHASVPEQDEGEYSDGDLVYVNPELPNDIFFDSFEEHMEEENGENSNFDEENGNAPPMTPLDPSSTQQLFWEGTWSQSNNTFSPEPLPYSGGPHGFET
jgi:hypothetical protein